MLVCEKVLIFDIALARNSEATILSTRLATSDVLALDAAATLAWPFEFQVACHLRDLSQAS